MITNLKNPIKTLKPQYEALYEGICPRKSVQMMFNLKDHIDTIVISLRRNSL
jgi:hypothetical protein